jgi:hypothetical protein
MNNTLKQHAQTLRLSGLLESLELRLQEAEANRLPYAQFLELLFQDEINVRHQRLISRHHKLADFRETPPWITSTSALIPALTAPTSMNWLLVTSCASVTMCSWLVLPAWVKVISFKPSVEKCSKP